MKISLCKKYSPLGSLAFLGYLMSVYVSFTECTIYIIETLNKIGGKEFPLIPLNKFRGSFE